ncbi:unnamed protein product [Pleuronectes platessa]|uniref:Uncharacterized protein n=1 Tax=Pleuronectes platessa TaxID=8262 RepID=A0A9N7Z1U5_PLEPL|nr:unnamed protein product [Pleuronectes platessa]
MRGEERQSRGRGGLASCLVTEAEGAEGEKVKKGEKTRKRRRRRRMKRRAAARFTASESKGKHHKQPATLTPTDISQSPINLLVFGLWEEAGENPSRHEENVHTPQRKTHFQGDTSAGARGESESSSTSGDMSVPRDRCRQGFLLFYLPDENESLFFPSLLAGFDR